tara:strand:- start:225 stop:533 length:309 start_codon:yes stop_codon:yes gene_type:complete
MTYLPNEVLLKIFSYCDDIKERKQKKNYNTLMKDLKNMYKDCCETIKEICDDSDDDNEEEELLPIWYAYHLDSFDTFYFTLPFYLQQAWYPNYRYIDCGHHF